MPRAKAPTHASLESTLVYLDEPQVVLLKTSGLSKIIAVAIEKDDLRFPFLGAEITADQFRAYEAERFDLRYLFESPGYGKWFFFDLDATDEDGLVPLAKVKPDGQMEAKYFPEAGFFARNHTVTESSAVVQQDSQRFKIDGAWDLTDLSTFGDRLTQVYSLLNGVDIYLDTNLPTAQRRRFQEQFLRPWRGGGSYVGFYKSLPATEGGASRLPLKSVVYNSPGHMDVRGKKAIFSQIQTEIEIYQSDNEAIWTQYKRLQAVVSENKLSKMDAGEFVKKYGRRGDLPDSLKSESKALSKILKALPYRPIYELSGRNPLIAAKIFLSFTRRLARLEEFFLQGRVTFPS